MCIKITSLKQHTKHTTIFSTVYDLSIVLIFRNPSNKASGLLFIFIRVSTDHTHFSNDEICISWVLFSCKTPEKSTRKAGLEVCGWLLCFQPGNETQLQAKAYLYVSNLEALFSLYFLYKDCFCHLNGLLMWVGVYGKK